MVVPFSMGEINDSVLVFDSTPSVDSFLEAGSLVDITTTFDVMSSFPDFRFNDGVDKTANLSVALFVTSVETCS